MDPPAGPPEAPAPPPDAVEPSGFSPARYLWAVLIARIYEVLPLICPVCGSEMRPIAAVTEPESVQRVLWHLGEPRPSPASPARPASLWDNVDGHQGAGQNTEPSELALRYSACSIKPSAGKGSLPMHRPDSFAELGTDVLAPASVRSLEKPLRTPSDDVSSSALWKALHKADYAKLLIMESGLDGRR